MSPNAIYTKKELAAFVMTGLGTGKGSGDNAISYAVNRNPTATYNYIKKNYGNGFQNVKPGGTTAQPVMLSMFKFLSGHYNALAATQQVHFAQTLISSLPATAEVANWTTATDQ